METTGIETHFNLGNIQTIKIFPNKRTKQFGWKNELAEISKTNFWGKKSIIRNYTPAGWYSLFEDLTLEPDYIKKSGYVFLDKDGNASDEITSDGFWAHRASVEMNLLGCEIIRKEFKYTSEAKEWVERLKTEFNLTTLIVITDGD